MARPDSTTNGKPLKPRPDFPLYAANNGQWAKMLLGKPRYFGVWADPKTAESLWLQERPLWEVGRNPREEAAAAQANHRITVGEMVALTLDAKWLAVGTGEIKDKTYREYAQIGQRLKDVWGAGRTVASLTPADFGKLKEHFTSGHPIAPRGLRHRPRTSKGHKSLVSLKGDVRKVRVFFNYIRANNYHTKSIPYGPFRVPTKKALRLERKRKPKRFYPAEKVMALIEAAKLPMQAMLWLGINCAFGPTDCAVLRQRELDLEGGWATFDREKTGNRRRCPLWPETVAALRDALAARPKPLDPAHDGLVFVTARGNPWADLSVCAEFKKVRAAAGCEGGPGFNALRHTFITVARRATRDHDAVRAVTGHITHQDDMLSSVYDEDWNDVEDERIRPVAEAVHQWLTSSGEGSSETAEARDVLPFVRPEAS